MQYSLDDEYNYWHRYKKINRYQRLPKMRTNLYSYAVIFLILAVDFENVADSLSSRDYYDNKDQEYL